MRLRTRKNNLIRDLLITRSSCDRLKYSNTTERPVRWSPKFSILMISCGFEKCEGYYPFISHHEWSKFYNSHGSDIHERSRAHMSPICSRRNSADPIRPRVHGERSLQLFFMPRDIFLNLIRRERAGIAAPKDEIERTRSLCASVPRDISAPKTRDSSRE